MNSMALASSASFHFFGSGKGESILIETRAGWGMIDCFTADRSAPSLNYLKSRGVTELQFLALTHPHDDHFGGLSEVAEWFINQGGIRQFWRYPTLDAKHLLPLLCSRAAQLGAPFAQQQLDAMSSLQRFYQLLATEIRSRRTTVVMNTIGQTLLSETTFGLELSVIAPTGNMAYEAEEALARSLEAQAAGRPLPAWNLNRLSSAYLVRSGGLELLLGGDVPRVSWESSMSSGLFPQMSLTLLKSSHHGSKGDNPKELLDRVLPPTGGELAVVTRYSPSRLPRADGVRELKQRFAEVQVIGRPIHPLTSGAVRRKRAYETQRLEVQVSSSGLIIFPPVAC